MRIGFYGWAFITALIAVAAGGVFGHMQHVLLGCVIGVAGALKASRALVADLMARR